MIHDGIMIITLVSKFLQRLIKYEAETAHCLINPVIKGCQ